MMEYDFNFMYFKIHYTIYLSSNSKNKMIYIYVKCQGEFQLQKQISYNSIQNEHNSFLILFSFLIKRFLHYIKSI
jgi:hypothetical protein